MPFTKRAISLQLHIACFFIGLILLFALCSNFLYFRENTRILLDAADTKMKLIGERAQLQMNALSQPAASFVDLLSHQRLMKATTLTERLDSLPYLVSGMAHQPEIAASFIGYANGDFFLIRRYEPDNNPSAIFHAPAGTAYIVQSQEQQTGRFLYFDARQKMLADELRPDYRFDTRSRSWYQHAMRSAGLVASAPYLFFTTGRSGITLSQTSQNGQAVIGVDIRLDTVSLALQQSRITPHTSLALVSGDGAVIAWQQGLPKGIKQADGTLRTPRLDELAAPALNALSLLVKQQDSSSLSFQLDGADWQGTSRQIPLPGSKPLTLLIAAPHGELLAEAITIRKQSMAISLVLLLGGVALAWHLARMASTPLRALAGEASKIQHFEFADAIDIDTHITEVNDLARAMDGMKTTIRQFLALSKDLANESNFQHLLERILREMKQLTHADGGIIYLVDHDAQALHASHALWQDTLINSDPTTYPILSLEQLQHPLLEALQQSEHVRLLQAKELQQFVSQPVADKAFTLLALPLHDRQQQLLGVLALFVDEARQPLGPELRAFAQALSSTASVAVHTQQLIEEQKALLAAFIQLLAGAIDTKSPYTGGHCQRVPELTRLLAEAACREQDGVFASFTLSEEEWEELHIAAWLHDCGKVTTPEYVVDKATKLETLCDRLHEVRMRFEVLKRDAELACWKAIAAGEDAATQQDALARTLAELDAEFAFVASCNEGGEFMSPDKITRLQSISARRWLRTLSDRIGISRRERDNKAAAGAEQLPVWENVLADKAEHIDPRPEHDKPPTDMGFRTRVPEHLYNRGELYNLSIGRGTLTDEERYKINEHIIQTIIMLNKLPLPRHLRRIPEIAGGHHEKMDGSGYPRQLTRDQMSWTARMMAIADIFEALTAGDRPYKNGKTLSEAIRIMSFMKKDQHIDPDLFDLFLRSGIYLDYAQRHMAAEQIDEVDRSAYLEQPAP